MVMKIAVSTGYRKPTLNFGLIKYGKTANVTKKEELLLRMLGWHVVNIWECELAPSKLQATLLNLEITLNGLLIKN